MNASAGIQGWIRAAVARQLVRLVNAVPSSIAQRFDTASVPARLLRPLANRLLPETLATVEVRSGPARGLRLRIDPQREKFYWSGLYEPRVQRAVVDVLGPGDVFWDVGAHIGFYSLLASRRVGADGRVHAFEPMPRNRARLVETIELNRAGSIVVHPCALAAGSGRGRLHAHESSSMWSLRGQSDDAGYEVECATLDQLWKEGSFGVPKLVKIDAEGAEIDIVRGGLELMLAHQVALLVEYGDGEGLADLSGVLPDYSIAVLSERHALVTRP